MNKSIKIAYWVTTVLLCLQMSFTAYAQLQLPQLVEVFTALGFPQYFRVELAVAKLVGVVVLLAPSPLRLKEWVHAGFAYTLASAVIAHMAIGESPAVWGWAAATGVLWAVNYGLWRRVTA